MATSLIEEIASTQEEIIVSGDWDERSFNFQISKLKLDRYKDNTKNRKWLAVWTAIIVPVWLTAVLAILIFNDSYICLSTPSVVTLLGTTSVNVLGLSYIVLKGYFDSISNNEV